MMTYSIFSHVGFMLILRFLHVASGTLWIGASSIQLQSPVVSRKTVLGLSSFTLFTGLLQIAGNSSLSFYSSWGLSMLLGSGWGFLMWLNLWLYQNENQRDRSQIFQHTNFAFAVPMLFFMEAASHMGMDVDANGNKTPVILALVMSTVILEVYAVIGKGPQIRKLSQALLLGIIITGLQYWLLEILTKASQ